MCVCVVRICVNTHAQYLCSVDVYECLYETVHWELFWCSLADFPYFRFIVSLSFELVPGFVGKIGKTIQSQLVSLMISMVQ